MEQYQFDGAMIQDGEGNPQKNKRGEAIQDPHQYSVERVDNKLTLQQVNDVREHFGLEPLKENIIWSLNTDLSGSHGSHMIVWDGKEFCIVPFDESLKSSRRGSGDDRDGILHNTVNIERTISIKDVTTNDCAFRCRGREDHGTLTTYTDIFSEYKEALEADESPDYPFPAIVVWKDAVKKDTDKFVLVTGYRRYAEWRLIIALWRFAGLRAVSEVLMLKWEDILWDQKLIMVHSPKTERYEGKGIRKIPFFPHIEECLIEAAEQAEEGAIYVVEKHAPLYLRGKKERVYVSRQGNIGTMFRKIMLRAGVVPWAKLIQNLRASFETDLINGKYGHFGIHTIAAWLGHSVQVMLKHYGRIQKADYDSRTRKRLSALQI